MLSTSNRGCCSCCNSGPDQDQSCRQTITSADLAELFYIAGLDEELCCKFQEIAEITNLVDCEGNPIARTTPIVTCAGFRDFLCETFADFEDGGAAILEGAAVGTPTALVGADCETYTIPETPITVVDTTCINLTANGEHNHTLTAALTISPDAGNMLTCTGNGAFVAETPLVANDSATVDFTTSGTANHTVTASVKISAVPNNCIVAQADGIYSECTDLCDDIGNLPVGAPSVPGVSSFVGTDCQTHVLTETPITVVDTLSVNLTSSGSFGHTIQADVLLDPDPDNIITITSGGLMVDCDDVAACVTIPDVLVADTITVDMTKIGDTISADVNVSAIGGNDLTIQVDGLYVSVCDSLAALPNNGNVIPGVTQLVGDDCQTYTIPAGADVDIVASDTNCINMSVVEAPAGTFTVSAVPIIDPAPGNLLTCGASGLLVSGSSSTQLIADDTDCISMSAVEGPADTWTISAEPVIALNHTGYPVGCNGLECNATGLSAPPDVAGAIGEEDFGGNFLNGVAMAQNELQASAELELLIENPSDCRSALLTIYLLIPAAGGEASTNLADNRLQVEINHEFNLPAVSVVPMALFTVWQVNMNHNGPVGTPPATRAFTFIVPPSFSGSYTVQVDVTQLGGDATGVFVGNIGSSYTLITI